jgi:hypothetical protein
MISKIGFFSTFALGATLLMGNPAFAQESLDDATETFSFRPGDRDRDRDRRDRDRRNRDERDHPRFRIAMLRCGSDGHRFNRCRVGAPIRNVRLVRQESRSPCARGRTWGIERNSIWVSNGCRAVFEVSLFGRY